MSQAGRFRNAVTGDPVTSITGNTGGPVEPTGGNIDLLGADPISVAGDDPTSTLTISIETATTTQEGAVTLATNVQTIAGMATDRVNTPASLAAKLGAQTQYTIPYGEGTSNAFSWMAAGTNGQLVIAATGGAPAFASLTSTDGSIVYTPGANTLNLAVDIPSAGGIDGLIPDSGTSPVVPDGSGDVTIAGGTNINTVGGTNTLTVNLDAAISLATSVTSPLYTVASGDLVLNMTDNAGANSVSFTNSSDAEVAFVDSLGAAQFTELDVDNININGNTLSSTNTNGDITLTPNGSGHVSISYLTQYNLPIAGASGALDDLADGLGSLGQILTSNGAGNEPTWEDAPAGGITWSVVTGSTQSCAVNSGYFANYNGTLAFTLPTTAAVGDSVQICQMFAGQGWTLAVNSGETIYIGNTNTTTTTGTLASTANGDWVELICRVANTDWACNVKSGNITVT